MDYSLAAVRMFCSQLRDAKPTSSQNATALGGVLFQCVWFQGVLLTISSGGNDSLVLDDGTCLVELSLTTAFDLRQWRSGMYVMVVGAYHVRTGEIPLIKVHKMVDLSGIPDREVDMPWKAYTQQRHRLTNHEASTTTLIQNEDAKQITHREEATAIGSR